MPFAVKVALKSPELFEVYIFYEFSIICVHFTTFIITFHYFTKPFKINHQKYLFE